MIGMAVFHTRIDSGYRYLGVLRRLISFQTVRSYLLSLRLGFFPDCYRCSLRPCLLCMDSRLASLNLGLVPMLTDPTLTSCFGSASCWLASSAPVVAL